MARYSKLFSRLEIVLQDFINEVNKSKLTKAATDEWSVKDVLCHITFWHGYYAEQYAALATNKKPFIFTSRGGSARNQEGVDSLKGLSKKDLIKKLLIAQKSLHKSIVVSKVHQMNYTDRTTYKTEVFLDVIIGHIIRHTVQVRRAKDVSG